MTDLPAPRPIREIGAIDRSTFDREVRPAGQPVVLRGLAADWPAVRAAKKGDEAAAAYFLGFGPTRSIWVLLAQPEKQGRLLYNEEGTALNFARREVEMAFFFDRLIRHEKPAAAPNAVAMQSEIIPTLLPGFTDANPMPLVDAAVEPRLWVGNRIQVAPHHDLAENVGVVVAGRRRFTLFPPDQIANLYLGPLELTPAGAPVSMVDLRNPDLARYPRYAEAAETAQAATLEPGDAIYIPLAWWHGVESLDPVSALVNYWWNFGPPGLPSAHAALMLAIGSIRNLDAGHRAVWQSMFDHYVFGDDRQTGEHLPEAARGLLSPPDPAKLAHLKRMLVQMLGS